MCGIELKEWLKKSRTRRLWQWPVVYSHDSVVYHEKHEVKGWWLIQGQVTGDLNQLILVLVFINSCKARSSDKMLVGLGQVAIEKDWMAKSKIGCMQCLSRDGCYQRCWACPRKAPILSVCGSVYVTADGSCTVSWRIRIFNCIEEVPQFFFLYRI